jgi:hypothetical protein
MTPSRRYVRVLGQKSIDNRHEAMGIQTKTNTFRRR